MSDVGELEKALATAKDSRDNMAGTRKTQKFTFEDDEPIPPVEVVDPGFERGRAGVAGMIVPIGNLADSDIIHKKSSKPAIKEPNTKWSGKGEKLTTDAAIQFMIKERAMMDLETAQLRRDNEMLRRSLEQKMQLQDRSPQVIHMAVPSKVGLSEVSDKGSSDSDLREQLANLKAENERLKLQHIAQGSSDSGSPIPAPPSSLALAQAAGAALSPPPVSMSQAAIKRDPLKKPIAHAQEEAKVICSILWDGGYLWKIPYNGKGAAERRIVALKRATVYPSPTSRAVRIDRGGSLSPPENYIAFPPTLMWYNSEKPGQVKNARELILYDGTCLMEGHNTNVFFKLANSDRPIPKPELCFSMMTTTRSLDLAAETLEQAVLWKDALHALLVEFSPNRAWAALNLRRNKPFWDHAALEDVPVPQSISNNAGPTRSRIDSVRNDKAETRQISAEEASPPRSNKPMKKEAIKQKLFATVRSKDWRTLEQMFKAGVPANLQDDKAQGDTALLIACRIGDADCARVCLQYGAKNDPHPDFGDTALHLATEHGHFDVAAIILRAAAQSDADHMIVNLTNEEKKAPLHIAAARGDTALIELLLEHGASVETKDDLDQTAIHVCAGAGHRDCLGVLLDQGGDHLLEVPDLGGNTALHHAAQGGHWHCTKVLLENAADVMVRNTRGQTAYKLSVEYGHQQIAKLLLEYTKDHKEMSSRSLSSSSTYGSASARSPLRHSIDNSALPTGMRTPNALRLSLDDNIQSYGMEIASSADVTLDVLHGSHVSATGLTPNAALPRPHTQGSPGMAARKQMAGYAPGQAPYSPMLGSPAPGASAYTMDASGRARASSDGVFGSPLAAPYDARSNHAQFQTYAQPMYDNSGYSPQPAHANHYYGPSGEATYGYMPGSARTYQAPHVDAFAYSPASARERPTPAMFDGQSAQAYYGAAQGHGHVPLQHGGISPVPSRQSMHPQSQTVDPAYGAQQRSNPWHGQIQSYDGHDNIQHSQAASDHHAAGFLNSYPAYDQIQNSHESSLSGCSYSYANNGRTRTLSQPASYSSSVAPQVTKGPTFYSVDP